LGRLIDLWQRAPAALVLVMRSFGWMAASKALAAVFSLIYLAIITRSLGVSGFGRFALITGSAQLLANLLAFQTWQIIVQYGVNHLENNDPTRLARLYRAAVVLDVVSAVTGIAAAATILYFFAGELGMTDTLARATLVFNVIMLFSLRSTPLGIMRLHNRFSLAAAAESAMPTLRLIGAVIAWYVHPKLQGFLIAWAAAELLTAAAHWYAAHRTGDLKLMWQGRNVGKVLADNPGILRYALDTNFSQTLSMTAKQLPLFLVGGLTGAASAGAFRLAHQLARSLTILSQMIARAAFPEIVRAVRSKGVEGLADMVARTIRVAFVVSAVVFIIVVLTGQQVLALVGGADFAQGYRSLLWLAGAACIELVVVTFEPSIMAARRAYFAFYARLVATATMVGGAFLLVPALGAEGVAAAVLLNSLTQALLLGLMLTWLIRQGEDKAVTSEA
jgi:O-antigen/teichoic acid export membrane protein